MVSVDLEKYPKHIEQLKKYAHKIIRDGETVQLPRATFDQIVNGHQKKQKQIYFGEPEPDPVKEQGCNC